MIEQIKALEDIDNALKQELEVEIDELQEALENMLSGLPPGKLGGDTRDKTVYIIERLQKLERDRDPAEPYGREDYQTLFDAVLRVMEEGLGLDPYEVKESFARKQQVKQLGREKRTDKLRSAIQAFNVPSVNTFDPSKIKILR